MTEDVRVPATICWAVFTEDGGAVSFWTLSKLESDNYARNGRAVAACPVSLPIAAAPAGGGDALPAAWPQVKLWFFRELVSDQRLSLFRLAGLPVDEIGESHSDQLRALKHMLRIATPAAQPEQLPEAVAYMRDSCMFLPNETTKESRVRMAALYTAEQVRAYAAQCRRVALSNETLRQAIHAMKRCQAEGNNPAWKKYIAEAEAALTAALAPHAAA